MTTLLLISQHDNASNSVAPSSFEDYHLVSHNELVAESDSDSISSDSYVKCDRPSCNIPSVTIPMNVDDTVPSLEDEECIDTSSVQETFVVESSVEPDSSSVKDNDENLSDEKVRESMNLAKSLEPCSPKQYGGLTNLGNTCYMAAALQMLASIDDFVNSINVNSIPLKERNLPSVEESIRELFVNMVVSMREGKTVDPEKFKTVLDERTPYFIGFEQQDAHEFLTTLLNVIDEEYEQKSPTKPNTEDSGKTDTASGLRSEESDCENDSKFVTKKARTETRLSIESENKTIMHPHTKDSASFTNLDVAAIENLLNGTSEKGDVSSMPMAIEPFENQLSKNNTNLATCKLAGGRMAVAADTVESVACYSRCRSNSADKSFLQSSTTQQDSVALDSASLLRSNVTSHDEEISGKCDISPVDEFFKTNVRVCLTCDSCKYSRTQEETYLHLPLEICDDPGFSIGDSLKLFFAPERREIKCEKCFCETALQTNEVTKLPRALLLHLKRFVVDISPDFSSITYTKNRDAVILEKEITLDDDFGVVTDFLSSDCSFPNGEGRENLKNASYQIRSVVNHMGSSVSCGHYTNDSMKTYDGGIREWTRFNDDDVTLISADAAIEESRETAYIVLYEFNTTENGPSGT